MTIPRTTADQVSWMTDRPTPRRLTALLALAPLAAGTLALATEWATNTNVLDTTSSGTSQQAAAPATVSPVLKRRIDRAMRKLDSTRSALNQLERSVNLRSRQLAGTAPGQSASGGSSVAAAGSASPYATSQSSSSQLLRFSAGARHAAGTGRFTRSGTHAGPEACPGPRPGTCPGTCPGPGTRAADADDHGRFVTMRVDDVPEVAFRAMATDVTLRVAHPTSDPEAALRDAQDVFARVEAACTRFDPTSPLMRANADPARWHDVPWELAAAVEEAAQAHRDTDGVFDPRILGDLVKLGYDRTLPFAQGRVSVATPVVAAGTPAAPEPARPAPEWQPAYDHRDGRHLIHLAGSPIDLGGIGKGLAVRWASHRLWAAGGGSMVSAGGDCQFTGPAPAEAGWRVGLEDPRGGADPLAVFEIADGGCATSSVRVRSWQVDGRAVHHLINPRTGQSGGEGLLAVTVIHPDVATAEVWSKTLFLSGPSHIRDLAAQRGLCAAWVESDGRLHVNDGAAGYLIWSGGHV